MKKQKLRLYRPVSAFFSLLLRIIINYNGRINTGKWRVIATMMRKELMILWNHASVKVLDVRHQIVQPGEKITAYQLPASVFLFTVRGRAVVQLNDVMYPVHTFHVIHGGKGLTLNVSVTDNEWESYIIFYKAIIPLPSRQEIMNLLKSRNWFLSPYSIVPQQPITLLDKLDHLRSVWNSGDEDELRQLRAKGWFHLFVCELLDQMDEQEEGITQHDLVFLAKQYIHQHYAEPITLEAIAQTLNYSIPYLSKQFKRQTGHSPIDYLIGVRLEKAKDLLVRTDATLQEVAEGVGYTDFSYFIRAFKKYTGLTPGQFKEQALYVDEGSEYPMKRLRSELVFLSNETYNLIVVENHSQRDRGIDVKGRMHKLVLGLALLLSACSGTTTGSSGTQHATPVATSATEATSQPTEQQWPRTYVDALGKEVVIPKEPKRIVVTHFGMMEYFFVLETPPIASTLADRMLTTFETLKPYASTATVKDIGEVRTPNLEMMADLNPDLIVAFSGTHNEVYADLSSISPVAMINNTEERSWTETLREYAKLIGKEQLAEDYITNLQTLMGEAREKLAKHKDKAVTFLRATGDGSTFYVLDDNDVSYAYDQETGLGLKSPGQYKLEGDVISLEGVTVLNPDYIFVVDHADRMDTTMAELNQSKVWQSLKAVKEKHVFPLDVSISTKGPLAIKYSTNKVLEYMSTNESF